MRVLPGYGLARSNVPLLSAAGGASRFANYRSLRLIPPEQRAYAAMIHLHDTYELHTIFAPGFPGMLECFYVQEKLVELLMPDVSEAFVSITAL